MQPKPPYLTLTVCLFVWELVNLYLAEHGLMRPGSAATISWILGLMTAFCATQLLQSNPPRG